MRESFTRMFRFYAEHHQQLFTKFMHALGVPMIILALQIFLGLLSPSLPWILLLSLFAFYLWLDLALAFITGIFLLVITLVSSNILQHQTSTHALVIASILFVFGWILPFLGHYREGKQPALFSNVFQIFIAPLFLTAELCFALGYREDLKKTLV